MSAVPAPALDSVRSQPLLVSEPVAPAIDAQGIVQRFDGKLALDAVSLAIAPGSIHALLGPNGAGKTTLIRILSGLLVPQSGSVRVLDREADNSRAFRRQIGLVPSGDRSFYLRISGLENLIFFGRLHGLRLREATRRARKVLDQVGLASAADRSVGLYSHGMQKRLSIARALLADPPILLVDEATHDLDPEGAQRVRRIVVDCAKRGAAIVWATQRLDEIRGLADRVTLLSQGQNVYAGTVPGLMAHARPRRYLVRLAGDTTVEATARATIGARARLESPPDSESQHYLLALGEDAVLGDVLGALSASGVRVLTCTEERSEIEQAFLSLAEGGG